MVLYQLLKLLSYTCVLLFLVTEPYYLPRSLYTRIMFCTNGYGHHNLLWELSVVDFSFSWRFSNLEKMFIVMKFSAFIALFEP